MRSINFPDQYFLYLIMELFDNDWIPFILLIYHTYTLIVTDYFYNSGN